MYFKKIKALLEGLGSFTLRPARHVKYLKPYNIGYQPHSAFLDSFSELDILRVRRNVTETLAFYLG